MKIFVVLIMSLVMVGCGNIIPSCCIDEEPAAIMAPVVKEITPPAIVEAEAPKALAKKPAQDIVYFDFDAFLLSDKYRKVLDKHATYITENGVESVTIDGHCDERGTREYNMALGERRANAVMRYLIVKGVNPDILSTTSYGEEKPAATGHNEGAWKKNRRAEINY